MTGEGGEGMGSGFRFRVQGSGFRVQGRVRRGKKVVVVPRVEGLKNVPHLEDEAKRLLRRNVNRFRGGLVLKAHRLCVSHNSRLESNKEEERTSKTSRSGSAAEAVLHPKLYVPTEVPTAGTMDYPLPGCTVNPSAVRCV